MTDREQHEPDQPAGNDAVTEQQLQQHYSKCLDASLETFDYGTQLKLEQARKAALEQSQGMSFSDNLRQMRVKRWIRWGASGIAIAATVAAITMTQLTVSIPASEQKSAIEASLANHQSDRLEPIWLEDIELLAADEELEFIENLEFYEWLQQDAEKSTENTLES